MCIRDSFDDNIAAWVPSYAAVLDPRHYERQWLIESIGPFYRCLLYTSRCV